MRSSERRINRLAAALAVCAALLAAGCGGPARTKPPASAAPPGSAVEYEIYFVDVGDGDCALISLPDGKWAAVDTGPASGAPALHGMLSVLGVEKLEAVFVSHPHKDHVGNLGVLLADAPCPVVYTTPADFGKATTELRDAAEGLGAQVKTLAAGQTVTIAGVTFTALGPNGSFTEENDNSLVLKVEGGGARALFPGDQLAEAEQALLNSGRSLRCDILKAAHHGQDDASGVTFLRAASPAYCVISTSDDPADAPGSEALGRMREAGAQVRIVGEEGTLRFSSATKALERFTPADPPPALAIDRIDTKAESVLIGNPTDRDVDMAGWSLLSDKGNQVFFFPKGFVLKAGGSVRVFSGMDRTGMPDGLFWTEEKVWKDKKDDRALLIDPYGRTAASR